MHTLALTLEGNVFAWGEASEGQLGIGENNTHITHLKNPVIVSKCSNIRFVSCGHSSSGAINRNGEVLMWGCNFDFRLMINEIKNVFE
jgi:alpha-tubulin suppressor-like RCC1 family protein